VTTPPEQRQTTPGEGSAFRVIDDRTVWSGWRLRIAEVKVDGPDGEVLERQVLHHPGAVAVLPLHEDGSVTLVRQYRVALDADIWEIPAGLRDVAGEPPERTAERELVEEAGLSTAELRHLTTFNSSPGFSDEAVLIFVGTELTEVPHDRQGPEEQHMVVERFPLETALTMVNDGRITDAKTVIALLLTALRH
jgi:8-oxo-dGTP pyrophosphatase MutT (NUDIX family)